MIISLISFLSLSLWFSFFIFFPSLSTSLGILGGTSDKESTCQCRRYKSHGFGSWIWKISWRRKRQPIPVLLPRKIPWIEEPGRLKSTGSQNVRRDWVYTHTHNFSDFSSGPLCVCVFCICCSQHPYNSRCNRRSSSINQSWELWLEMQNTAGTKTYWIRICIWQDAQVTCLHFKLEKHCFKWWCSVLCYFLSFPG